MLTGVHRYWSEDQLYGELHQPRWSGLQDLPERWRLQIVLRQSEVRVVQQIEAFRAELHARGLGDVEVLEQREVDVLDARSAHHVSALVSELAGLRRRIELLKCRTAHPLIRRVPALVGVGDEIRP